MNGSLQRRRDERGQVLPIMALLVVAFIGLLGLAIDLGRIYVARAELSRAVDAAALAGVVELPSTSSAQTKAAEYLNENLPEAQATFLSSGGQYQLRLRGERQIDTMFMGIFGFGEVDISATAAAGFGIIPLDAVLAIDSTGSMGASPCNSSQSNSGCPIKEAKDAASLFTETLLGGTTTETLVGAVPYRGCYNPPRSYSVCIPGNWIENLTSNETYLQGEVADFQAQGGTGTNVCLGLKTAGDVLFGAGSHTQESTLRFIVILTDGDNTYNSSSYGQGAPPTDCRPDTSPWNSDGNVSSSCSSAQTRERELDDKTLDMANGLKASDVEIYVVGFGVCGNSSTALCDVNKVGNSDHDDDADRNLLKCIASSTSQTNDHFYEVPTAEDLPAVFTEIAQAIAFRLIE